MDTVDTLEAQLAAVTNRTIQSTQEEVRIALRLIATGAREQDPDCDYVICEDSDQGDWLVVMGLHYKQDADLRTEPDGDWTDAASHLYTSYTSDWLPYCVEEPPEWSYRFDINKVLEEVT